MDNKIVTIRDVAKIAGVSVSTVSRALNNSGDISDKTRKRIFKIAEDIGYKPNIIAKSLSSGRYNRFGMLVEDYENTGATNPFVYEVLMAFKNTLTKNDCEMVLLSTTSDMQKTQNLNLLFNEKQIDGAFILGLKMTDEYYKQLSEAKCPCVLFDIDINNNMLSSIGVNSVKGAFMAVEHLIGLGHRRIGFINGSKDAFVSYDRLDGYYLALSRHGIQVDENLIIHSDYTNEGAEAAVKELVEKCPDITAIFCASDLMALGAVNMLNTMGYAVPGDISIVGFDDIYLAQVMKPKLTTIRQDREKIGERAANILINMSTGQQIGRVILEPELIIRESTRQVK